MPVAKAMPGVASQPSPPRGVAVRPAGGGSAEGMIARAKGAAVGGSMTKPAARSMESQAPGSPGGMATAQPAPQPAWQQLAAMGVGGQGSAAANKAKLAEMQGAQPTLQGPPMGGPPSGPPMMQGGFAGQSPQQLQAMAQESYLADQNRFGPGNQNVPWQGPFNDALRRRMQMQGGGMPGQPGMQAQPMPGQVPGGAPQGFGGNPQGIQIRSIQDLYGGGGPALMGFRQGGSGMQGGGFQSY